MITEHISIVIVEKQPIMRVALSTAFSVEGITVLAELGSSMEALQVAPKLNPNVVLLAVGTPGWEEMDMILALHKSMPASALVALVTGEIPGQEHTVSKHGADLVLTKSTPRSELLNAIKELLQKRKYSVPAQVQ